MKISEGRTLQAEETASTKVLSYVMLSMLKELGGGQCGWSGVIRREEGGDEVRDQNVGLVGHGEDSLLS